MVVKKNALSASIKLFPGFHEILVGNRCQRVSNGRTARLEGNEFHRSGNQNFKIYSFHSPTAEQGWRQTEVMFSLNDLIAHGQFDWTSKSSDKCLYRVELARKGSEQFLTLIIGILEFIREGEIDPFVFSALLDLSANLNEVCEDPLDF